MKIKEIIKQPTTIDNNHESLFRCYHILDKVKEWLDLGMPTHLVSDLIEELK